MISINKCMNMRSK